MDASKEDIADWERNGRPPVRSDVWLSAMADLVQGSGGVSNA